jgi:flagellar basal-body rod protein FlgB
MREGLAVAELPPLRRPGIPPGGDACSSKGKRIADTTDKDVTPSQFGQLANMRDVTALRHKVLAQNIANVSTPGYHRLDVSFENVLGQQMGRGRLGQEGARIVDASDAPERADGNNVDIDAEMGRVSNNTLLFNAFTQILPSKLATLRSAINGR